MTLRRSILSGLTAVLVTGLLAACAGLPQSGVAKVGLPLNDQVPDTDFALVPEGPQPQATREQIVAGFLRAGSGTADSWATAQEFLTPTLKKTWQPSASVTIDRPESDRSVTVSDSGQVKVTLSPIATIGETGIYESADGASTNLTFDLVRIDGQWRISRAPDGVVLNRDVFSQVFHQYALNYFDTQLTYLVPDVRWFPSSNAPTRIANALIDGKPSAWLAETVTNAFPDSVALSTPSVPIEAGVAQVSLNQAALSLDRDTLNRMKTQLHESLSGAGVADVQLLYGSTPLQASLVTELSTRVPSQALVLTPAGFGFSSGDDLEAIPGLSQVMLTLNPAPNAIEVAASQTTAAVRLNDGSVMRVESNGEVVLLDGRRGLLAPSIDPFGFIWTVPGSDPSAVLAISPSIRMNIAEAWSGVAEILAMSISRDGTRIVASVQVGSTSALWVAGVIRDADGVPLRLGPPVALADLTGPATAVGWLDEATVGALFGSGDKLTFLEQIVGGPGTMISAPSDAVSISGSTAAENVRLRGSEGELYSRRAQNWLQRLTGVQVLATQQGTPAQ